MAYTFYDDNDDRPLLSRGDDDFLVTPPATLSQEHNLQENSLLNRETTSKYAFEPIPSDTSGNDTQNDTTGHTLGDTPGPYPLSDQSVSEFAFPVIPPEHYERPTWARDVPSWLRDIQTWLDREHSLGDNPLLHELCNINTELIDACNRATQGCEKEVALLKMRVDDDERYTRELVQQFVEMPPALLNVPGLKSRTYHHCPHYIELVYPSVQMGISPGVCQ